MMNDRCTEVSAVDSELSSKESRQSMTSSVDDYLSSWPRAAAASGDHVGPGKFVDDSSTGRMSSAARTRSMFDARELQTAEVTAVRTVSHPSLGHSKAVAAAAEQPRADNVVPTSTSTADWELCDAEEERDLSHDVIEVGRRDSRRKHHPNERDREAERESRERTINWRRQNSQPIDTRSTIEDIEDELYVLTRQCRSANTECPTRPPPDSRDRQTDIVRSRSAQLLLGSATPPPVTTSKPPAQKIANVDDKSAAQRRTASSIALGRKRSFVVEPDSSGNSVRNEKVEKYQPETDLWLDEEIGIDELMDDELRQVAFATSNDFDDHDDEDEDDDEDEVNTESILMQLRQLASVVEQKPPQLGEGTNGRKTDVVRNNVRPRASEPTSAAPTKRAGASRSRMPVLVPSSSSILDQDDVWDDALPGTRNQLADQPPTTARTKRGVIASGSGSRSRTPAPARSSSSILHPDEVCDDVIWDDVQPGIPNQLPARTPFTARAKRVSASASASGSGSGSSTGSSRSSMPVRNRSSSSSLHQDDVWDDDMPPAPAAAPVKLPEQSPSKERIKTAISTRQRTPAPAPRPSSRLQRGGVVAARSPPSARAKTYAQPTISVNAKQTGPVFTWNRPSAAANNVSKNTTTSGPSSVGRGTSNRRRVDSRQPANAAKGPVAGATPAARGSSDAGKIGNQVQGSLVPAAAAAATSRRQPATAARQTKSAARPPTPAADTRDNGRPCKRSGDGVEPSEAESSRPSEQLSQLAARLPGHRAGRWAAHSAQRGSRDPPGRRGDVADGGSREQTVEDVYVEAMSLDAEGRVSGQSSVAWRQEIARIIDSLRHQLRSRDAASTSPHGARASILTSDDVQESSRYFTPVTARRRNDRK